MKSFLYVIVAFAAFQTIHCYIHGSLGDSEELDNQLQLKTLRDRLRQRQAIETVRSKLNDICPGYGSRLENVTMEIQLCAALIDEHQETFCSMAQNHLKKCAAPMTEMLEECLPAKAKKIPEMAIKMLLASAKHLCKSDGEHIFELGNECIMNVTPKTQRCIRRVQAKVQDFQRRREYPSPQDICETAESMKPCLESHLQKACGNQITRESFQRLYDEWMTVCKGYDLNAIEDIEPSVV